MWRGVNDVVGKKRARDYFFIWLGEVVNLNNPSLIVLHFKIAFVRRFEIWSVGKDVVGKRRLEIKCFLCGWGKWLRE